MQNKKALIAIAVAFILLGIGGTFAYFFYTESFSNVFHISAQRAEFSETFVSPTDWTPCTETPKSLIVNNGGTVPIDVRISLEERWEKLNEDRTSITDESLPLIVNNQSMAIKNLTNTSDWVKNGNYYYYRSSVAPDNSTSSFINSVTFNCAADSAYSSARYHLILHVETIQSDARAQASDWN